MASTWRNTADDPIVGWAALLERSRLLGAVVLFLCLLLLLVAGVIGERQRCERLQGTPQACAEEQR